MPVRRATLLALMAVAISTAAAAAAPAELYHYVRELQALQDAMVRGDAKAQKLRMKLLSDIGRKPPAAGTDIRNTRAAIVYVLSGGMPEVGESYLRSGDAGSPLRPLLQGAIAYARGDKPQAALLLLAADLKELPPALAGQIYLVRSSLRQEGEHQLMQRDLAMARLLMPGTLVEDSALRRSAAIAAEARDLAAFERVSSLYFRRFGGSVYAGQFASAFVQFATSLGYEVRPERLAVLGALIGSLPPDKAAFVFLGLAQRAVLGGHRALGSFAAHKAMDLAGKGGPEAARAQLYSGAVLVTGDAAEFETGLQRLAAVDRQFLIPKDAALLRDALKLAAAIRRAPGNIQGPPHQDSIAGMPPAAARAQRALADIEAAMGEGS